MNPTLQLVRLRFTKSGRFSKSNWAFVYATLHEAINHFSMFTTIFKYEIKYWLKQPTIYIYAAIIFGISFITMTGMASEPPDRFNDRIVNSAIFMFDMVKKFMLLLFLLLPAIIGQSIQRDFSANTHSILYSYPISKKQYLLGKFCSSFTIFLCIAGLLFLGFYLGGKMPWVNPGLIGDSNPMVYWQLFGVFLLPNLLLLSLLIFGAVLWTRNIYMGFVVVLLFILSPPFFGFFFSGANNPLLAGIVDPMGTKAISYYTENWTVAEQNTLLLPIKEAVIYNRLFILGLAFLLFAIIYKRFQFHQSINSFSLSNALNIFHFSKLKEEKKGVSSAIQKNRKNNRGKITILCN